MNSKTSFRLKNKQMFIMTLSDIFYQENLTKIKINDVVNYKFKPYLGGYIWIQKNTNLSLKNIALILNDCNDTGLKGTYHDGEIKRYKSSNKRTDRKFLTSRKIYKFYDIICKDIYSESCNIANEYVFESNYVDDTRKVKGLETDVHYYIDPSYQTRDDYSISSDIFKLKNIPDYNNIPILFYIDRVPDLVKYDMKVTNKVTIENFHIYDVVLYNGSNKAGFQIGKMVLSPELIDMMLDQAGVAVFNNCKAFGNFKYWESKDFEKYKNLEIFENNCPYDSEQFTKVAKINH